MVPVLVRIDTLGVSIESAHVAIALAVVVCFVIGPRWIEALEGIDRRRSRRAMVVLGLAAFAGLRLHFVLNQWRTFAQEPLRALAIWQPGIHAGGAVIFLVLAAPFVCRFFRIPVAKLADGFVPTIGIGIAIARLGCFPAGCCFGTVTRLPWAITYPEFTALHPRPTHAYVFHAADGLLPAHATHSLPVHPLMLYFSAVGVVITVVAVWLHRRKRYDGEVALVGLLLFSVTSAALEFLRADQPTRAYWGPLPQLEWTALAMAIVAAGAFVMAERRQHRRGARSAPRRV